MAKTDVLGPLRNAQEQSRERGQVASSGKPPLLKKNVKDTVFARIQHSRTRDTNEGGQMWYWKRESGVVEPFSMKNRRGICCTFRVESPCKEADGV